MAVCWLRLAATKSSASDACTIPGSSPVSHTIAIIMRMAFMTSLPGGGLVAGGFHRLVRFFVIPGDKRAPRLSAYRLFGLPDDVELAVTFDFTNHDGLMQVVVGGI